MKVSSENLNKMNSLINKLANHYKIDLSTINNVNDYYFLWCRVSDNIRYSDDNGNVIKLADGSRLFEQNESHKFYVDNTNDTTIMTALKEIMKLNK